MAAAADRMAARREAEQAEARAESRVLRGDRRPKRNVFKKTAVGVLGLLILATAAVARRPKPPELPPSCEVPAFALSSPVKQARPVAFTIVGPPDRRYAIGVDTAGFVREGGAWRAVPLRGVAGTVVVRDELMPSCKRVGAFAMNLPLGKHVVTLYELRPDGEAVEVQREEVDLVLPEDAEDVNAPARR